MRRVCAYPLYEYATLELPAGAKALSIRVRYGAPYLMALVDDAEERKEIRHFVCFMDDEEIPQGVRVEYVATVDLSSRDAAHRYHFFEVWDL